MGRGSPSAENRGWEGSPGVTDKPDSIVRTDRPDSSVRTNLTALSEQTGQTAVSEQTSVSE